MRSVVLAVFAAAALLASGATNSSASLYASGDLSTIGGTILSSNAGYWTNVTLHWEVDKTGNVFTYTYTFNIIGTGRYNPDLSHMTIETSPGFLFGDLLTGTTGGSEVGKDPTSPLVDGTSKTLYGVKWDAEGNNLVATIVTNKTPVWGDVFLKSGQVDAWNSGYFLADPTPLDPGLNINGYLAVPDTTTTVPIPPAAYLLGAGLIGLAVVRKKIRK